MSTIEGVDSVLRKLAAFSPAVQRALEPALESAADSVLQTATTMINEGHRSGRIYYRNGESHQASAPGEPPKTWSGELVDSLFKRVMASELYSETGTASIKGKWLEFGTSRMEPRPWLHPSFAQNIDAARVRMKSAVSTAIMAVANG